MTDLEFKNILENDIEMINKRLIDLLPNDTAGQGEVVEAMKYSLVNGGKRIRPVLALEFAKSCGGSKAKALDFACAVEYIHTYS
ncbi:MAG: polyprenyl synthetase family protein, partial [Clostridiales bacterium]|nr:polyprenyl synthetase family protein [Clostridiales bacterium]